jgi:hypothetical protein
MEPKEVSGLQHETTPLRLASRGRDDEGRPQRFTVAQVRAAIVRHDGCLAQVARALRCSRSIVQDYCLRFPELYVAQVHAREGMIDEAEAQLFKRVKEGDLRAIRFLLTTQGKQRGYVERAKPLDNPYDMSRLSDAELLALGPLLAKLSGRAGSNGAPTP